MYGRELYLNDLLNNIMAIRRKKQNNTHSLIVKGVA